MGNGAATGLGVVLLTMACVGTVPAQAQQAPKGWYRAGMNADDYVTSVDPKGGRAGGPCAFIKARTPEAKTPGARGFGTLMQTFAADEYRGKRLRLSAFVKPAGVAGWAGLWMRIDGPDSSRPLAFDNMQDRPIKGTAEWKSYEIVLDVSPQAITVNFGILLHGAGEVWLDGVKLEAVGPNVPVTGTPPLPTQPVNLDFAQH
jgi:hypothetical protein